MGPRLLTIRLSSALRAIADSEVHATLRAEGRDGVITDVSIDTVPFSADIEGGYWDESEGAVRVSAEEVRRLADEQGQVELHYFGIGEIPHVIALGAYVGDERFVHVHDYHRTLDSWAWPEQDQTVSFKAFDVPRDPVAQSGAAVLRLEISDSIADSEVDAVVGREKLADIKIRPTDGAPFRGIIKSPKDVADVRKVLRDALAQLAQVREVDTLHLFVAAPVSVCFVVGQELHLRSGSVVQTYRHRSVAGVNSYQPAIRLSSGEISASNRPLTDDERTLAIRLRSGIFASELSSLITYATTKRDDASDQGQPWFTYLLPREQLSTVAPFRTLPPVWRVIDERDSVSEEPFHDPLGYARDKDRRHWRLGDRLLLGFFRAVDGDEGRLRQLARLFFLHEYLHDYQVLTKYTAEDVGSFANCLERIDYLADLYALTHQLDFSMRQDRRKLADETSQKDFIADQIDLAIHSFWAFEPAAPNVRWQERRLRRYLNWFWRQVQVRRAGDLMTAFLALSRQPAIEVAGLTHSVGRGRVFVLLDRPRLDEDLEIGLVLEDDRFQRYGTAGDLSIERMLEAFTNAEHDQIQRFFNSLFETVNATGGALPRAAS